MHKHSFYLAILAMLAFAVACDDDNPSSPVDTSLKAQAAFSYMPLEEGNYWIYENAYYDENGDKIKGDEEYPITYDSVFVSMIGEYNGKNAARVTTINDTTAEHSWWTLEGDNIYLYMLVEPEEGEEGGELYEEMTGWWKYHSIQNENITLLEYDNTDTIIDEEMGEIIIESSLDIQSKSYDGGMMDFLDVNAKSRRSDITYDIFYSLGFISSEMQIVQKLRFLEGVGLIEMEGAGFDEDMLGIGDDEEEPEFEPTVKSVLVRYSVK